MKDKKKPKQLTTRNKIKKYSGFIIAFSVMGAFGLAFMVAEHDEPFYEDYTCPQLEILIQTAHPGIKQSDIERVNWLLENECKDWRYEGNN